MPPTQLHQIFYDAATRASLDPGFIPLDNLANPRPDWFELFPIRQFLLRTELDDNTWYGFFSPKFRAKTLLAAADVKAFLAMADADADVALFSPAWDQVGYFLNPFEQGEQAHPGLTELSQQFLESQGIRLNLRSYVAHSSTTVYCNFFAAKPVFWRPWLALANAFFDEVEAGTSPLARAMGVTSYGSHAAYPMKTFIQERFASVLLATRKFRVANADLSGHVAVTQLFQDDMPTRRRLVTCDALKQDYLVQRDESYMDMYEKIRASIPLRRPLPSTFL